MKVGCYRLCCLNAIIHDCTWDLKVTWHYLYAVVGKAYICTRLDVKLPHPVVYAVVECLLLTE